MFSPVHFVVTRLMWQGLLAGDGQSGSRVGVFGECWLAAGAGRTCGVNGSVETYVERGVEAPVAVDSELS